MSHRILLLIACISVPTTIAATIVDVPPNYTAFTISTSPLACSAINPSTLSVGFNSRFFSDFGYPYASNTVNFFAVSMPKYPFVVQSSNQMITQVRVNGVNYPRLQVPIWSNTTSSITPLFDGNLAWNFGIAPQSYALQLGNPNDLFILSTTIVPRTNTFTSFSASLSNPTTFETGCLTLNFTSPCVYLPTSTVIEVNIPELFSDKGNYKLNAFDSFNDSACDVTLAGYARPPDLQCTKTLSSLYIHKLFQNNYTASTASVKICNLKTTFGALATPLRVRLLSKPDLSTNSIFVSSALPLTTQNPTIAVSNVTLLPSATTNKWSLSFRLNHPAAFIMLQTYKVEVQFSTYCFNTSQVNVSMLHQDDVNPTTYTSPISSTSSLISYSLAADLKLDKGGVMTIDGIIKPTSSAMTAQVILRDKFNRALSQQTVISLTFPSA